MARFACLETNDGIELQRSDFRVLLTAVEEECIVLRCAGQPVPPALLERREELVKWLRWKR